MTVEQFLERVTPRSRRTVEMHELAHGCHLALLQRVEHHRQVHQQKLGFLLRGEGNEPVHEVVEIILRTHAFVETRNSHLCRTALRFPQFALCPKLPCSGLQSARLARKRANAYECVNRLSIIIYGARSDDWHELGEERNRGRPSVPAPNLKNHPTIPTMSALLLAVPPVAAAGYSLLYLLFGGGLFGAIVIFVVAKMLGK